MTAFFALATVGISLVVLLTAYAVVRIVLALRELSARQSVALAGVRR